MVTYFKDQPSNASRALQIWQILIGKAHNRQTLTYGMLAQLLGFKRAGTLAHPLGHIMHYCQLNNLPPLTVLVVNQDRFFGNSRDNGQLEAIPTLVAG